MDKFLDFVALMCILQKLSPAFRWFGCLFYHFGPVHKPQKRLEIVALAIQKVLNFPLHVPLHYILKTPERRVLIVKSSCQNQRIQPRQ